MSSSVFDAVVSRGVKQLFQFNRPKRREELGSSKGLASQFPSECTLTTRFIASFESSSRY